MSLPAAIVGSLPWTLGPVVSLLRWRNSRSLDDVSPDVDRGTAPLVSVIIPARNEARNIERCVRSVLASQYPNFETIVVDDHSTDETGRIVQELAEGDIRLHVLSAPELPAGWFGKQWACASGAARAKGEIIVFTDADTYHAPDLLPRVVNAMREREADLLSVAGTQETKSFWERIVQPHLFAMLLARYGGTESVSNAKRAVDVIANGQFIAVRRDAYDRVGGHAKVRERVAEDMAIAQEFFRAGRRVVLYAATEQFSTHMYSGLREVVAGWSKNIYAGGRDAALGGAAGRALYPLVLIGWPLLGIAPVVALAMAAFGLLSQSWLIWSVVCVAFAIGFWTVLYRFMKQPLWYALLFPLGYLILGYIAVTAVMRGNRVQWKQRRYVAR
ncbi:MAG: glycosyltransferase [Gemmatimonadaceae bacterium]